MEDRGVSEEDAKMTGIMKPQNVLLIIYRQKIKELLMIFMAVLIEKVVFKNGQKVIKRKRVSGHFKMTPAQKMAIATANRKRMKSKTARKRAGRIKS